MKARSSTLGGLGELSRRHDDAPLSASACVLKLVPLLLKSTHPLGGRDNTRPPDRTLERCALR
eukprot:7568490-Alexandrium_andersonii.AAC.1